MLRIKLDGMLIAIEEHSSLKTAKFTFEKNDRDGIRTSFSSTITFYGSAAQYIQQQLIDAPNAYANIITADVFDDCCDPLVYTGQITSKTIEWCADDCAIKATIVERKDIVDSYQCIDKTFIWDNRLGFQSQRHPFVRHCLEIRPASLFIASLYGTIVVMSIMVMLMPVFVVVLLVGVIVAIIINILSTLLLFGLLGSVGDLDDLVSSLFGMIDFWKNAVSQMANALVSCGRGHPAPYVRDYLRNGCSICGLTFQSSIFTNPASPYYNAMLYASPVTPGTEDYISFSPDDKPIMTVRRFLETLKDTFNGDFRIINNILLFERKDYFEQGGTWIDISDLRQYPPEVIKLCFRYNSEKEPAAARFRYSDDAIDFLADEARWRYDDLVDYDPPLINSNLQGLKEINFPFGRARFRYDGISEDILKSTKPGLALFAIITAGATAGCIALAAAASATGPLVQSIVGAAISFISFVTSVVTIAQDKEGKYDSALLMAQDQSSPERILIHDTATPIEDARIIRQPYSSPKYSPAFHYNIPMWVAAGGDSKESTKIHITPNLYTEFWSIEDPRIRNYKVIEFELVIKRDCDLIQQFSFDKKILLPEGKVAYPNIIEITYSNITIKGVLA